MKSSVSPRFNAELLEQKYDQWCEDPQSVDSDWSAFFDGFELGVAQIEKRNKATDADSAARSTADITVDDALPTGQNIQYGASLDAAMNPPPPPPPPPRGDLRNASSWYDGKTYTRLNTDRNLYASWKAPSSVDGLIDKLKEKLGHMIPLSSLFYSDPYKVMSEGIQSSTYAGLHLVSGTPCHHLLLTQEDMDAQIWIEEGTQLVFRKVVLTFKNIPGAPQFTAIFSGWDFTPRLPEILFSFVPPEGADKIEFIPVDK